MRLTPPRRYWLTGAGSGIGAALAEEILKNGAHLAVSSRSVASLNMLSERYPGQVLVVAGDLTNSQTVREIGEQIADSWGSLDTVIINAGTSEYVDAKQFDAASIIEHVVRTNLLASSYCIEASVPLLRHGVAPHLVGIASPVTYLPLPRAESAGTAKAGMRYLFESRRIDLAPEGIEVTVVSPGFVDKPLTTAIEVPQTLNWAADEAARLILAKIRARPLDIAFAAVSPATLWPLSQTPDQSTSAIGTPEVRKNPPIKDQP
jgi:NAD(P)-dependent dehydrogenase (short-subunit alcohol dehydrogenase family)